jgi:hypothetical protein
MKRHYGSTATKDTQVILPGGIGAVAGERPSLVIPRSLRQYRRALWGSLELREAVLHRQDRRRVVDVYPGGEPERGIVAVLGCDDPPLRVGVAQTKGHARPVRRKRGGPLPIRGSEALWWWAGSGGDYRPTPGVLSGHYRPTQGILPGPFTRLAWTYLCGRHASVDFQRRRSTRATPVAGQHRVGAGRAQLRQRRARHSERRSRTGELASGDAGRRRATLLAGSAAASKH